MSKKRSASSTRWLNEHKQDLYVNLAKKLGVRSRAHFKLAEIQEKTKLIQPNMQVVDLGSAPGAWSILAANIVGNQIPVISCDLLPISPAKNIIHIQGDFDTTATQTKILTACSKPIEIILSDIAPNTSGIKAQDQLQAIALAESVLLFCHQHLATNGCFLIKLFHGVGFDDYLAQTKTMFKTIKILKPKASRNRSTECYLLGINKLPVSS